MSEYKESSNPWGKTQGGFTQINNMKFVAGSNLIRILPSTDPKKYPFHEYISHWIEQKDNSKKLIVHKPGTPCILCKKANEIWKNMARLREEEGLSKTDPKIKELEKKRATLRGKREWDVNIFDRNDYVEEYEREDNTTGKRIKIKRARICTSMQQTIRSLASNQEYGSPSDPETGYDITIEAEGEGMKRTYTLTPSRKSSPLNDKEINALKRNYDLEDLRKFTSKTDILEILKNGIKPYFEIYQELNTNSEDFVEKNNDKIEDPDSEIGNSKIEETKTNKKSEKKNDKKPEVKVEKNDDEFEDSDEVENTIDIDEPSKNENIDDDLDLDIDDDLDLDIDDEEDESKKKK
ncbi:MAG: hypothetical protein WC934_11820 [Acidithiobacillus sp.]|jgi:hypothetical protein|uniref:hypothetical protein n=1 Tax=Acidithiobacillus sp. TaxID=1872118 RepID=UPI00355CF86D